MKKMRKENLKIVYQYLSDDISPLFAVAFDTMSLSHILRLDQAGS